MAIYKGFSTYNRKKRYTVSDFELVKQDLFNHFNIRRGEKLMRPAFGTRIWNYIFEPMTEQVRSAISEEISEICSNDPRIKMLGVEIGTYEQGINIKVNLLFITENLVDVMYLKFDRDNQRLLVQW